MPDEITNVVSELATTFEEFKATLAERERKAEQLIAGRISRLEAVMSRPGGNFTHDASDSEHKATFARWLQKGVGDRELLDFENKSLSAGSGTDGGFAVPEQISTQLEKLLLENVSMRRLASVESTTSASLKVLVDINGTTASWVGEVDARPETATPKLAQVEIVAREIFAQPAATQQLIDDASFSVEQWLIRSVGEQFALSENAAFINGTGVLQPKGILTLPTAATSDATRAFGTIQHVATGVSGGFPGTNPADILVDLRHALRAPYRAGASWLMNDSVLATVRKLKDSTGRFLFEPSLREGEPDRLLGHPVVVEEEMSDIAAGSLSIAFGNFGLAYKIADRVGTRVLRDPFSNKPFVRFYTTRRVGGEVINSQAYKLLKFALA